MTTCVCLLILSIAFLRFIHVVMCITTSFLLMTEYFMDKHFVYSSTDSCFYFGTVMNSSINIHAQVFVEICVFISLENLLRNRIVELYNFDFLRNCSHES